MWNDRNDVTYDGNNVYYWKIPTIRAGAVSMLVVADGDVDKIYAFDENRRIFLMSREESKRIDVLRQKILSDHNTVLTGFFGKTELNNFDYVLSNIKNNLGVDFSKYEEVKKGKKLNIIEDEIYSRLASAGESKVYWSIDTSSRPLYRLLVYNFWLGDSPPTVLAHEIAHTISTNELDSRFITKANELGMDFPDNPEDSIPYIQAKANIYPRDFPTNYFWPVQEFVAVIFEKMFADPKWFNTPERHAFRDIWLEELKKYKK
jgi:hypothetical protein